MKIIKKIFTVFIFMFINSAYAYNVDTLNAILYEAQSFYSQNQFTKSILAYKAALKMDNTSLSANLGLINSYLARATYYYNKEKNFDKSSSDLKSALFYLKYNDLPVNDKIKKATISTENNLKDVEKLIEKNISSDFRFKRAKTLRSSGEFASSAYDFILLTNDNKYKLESLSNLGDLYVFLDNDSKALKAYRDYMSLDPNNGKVAIKLAKIYQRIGDTHNSSKFYNIALQNDCDKTVLEGLYNLYLDNYKNEPNNAQNLMNLGVVCQKLGETNRAYNYYKKALKLEPKNDLIKLNYGILLSDCKKYNDAIRCFNEIINKNGRNYQALLARALCYEKTDKINDAISDLKHILAYDPNNETAKSNLNRLIYNNLSNSELLTYLNNEIKKDPQNAQLNYDLAIEYHKNKNLTDAIHYYKKSIQLGLSDQNAYINLAKAQCESGNYEAALNTIKNAKTKYNSVNIEKFYEEILAECENAKNINASNAFNNQDYDLAIKQYMQIDPPTLDSLSGIASSYLMKNDYKEALNFYNKAFKLNPENIDVLYGIAYCYYCLSDYNNAYNYAKKITLKFANNEKANELIKTIDESKNIAKLNEAIDLYNSKKYTESLSILSKLISQENKNNINYENIYYYRGLNFDALNKPKEAIEDYKNALKINPDFNIIYYLLGVDYDTLNNKQKALSAYKTYLEKESDASNLSFIDYSKERINELNNNLN